MKNFFWTIWVFFKVVLKIIHLAFKAVYYLYRIERGLKRLYGRRN